MSKRKIMKIICIILIILLMLSLFTINTFATNTPSDINVWDGTISEPEGNGTKESPFLISNGAELAFVISTGGGAGNNYKLTNDIYLNEINKVNWSTGEGINGYSPRPWYDSVEFQGSIDGNGHIVHGIYYNAGLDTSEMVEGWGNPVGLIPAVKNGAIITVEKLGIDNMYINAKSIASAFVGSAGNSAATTPASRSTVNIDRCFVGENVNVTAFCAGVFRGYSRNSETHISNSYSLGYFRSNCDKKNDFDGNTYDYRFSWLVGNNWGNGETKEDFSIYNSYNATGALFKGKFAIYDKLIINCYAAGLTQDRDGDGIAEEVWYSDAGNTPLNKEQMQGFDVLDSISKMPYLNANNEFLATEGYPILKAFTDDYKQDDVVESENIKVWDGSIAETLSGEGTKAFPYLISNGSELALMITSGGGADNHYKLIDDIYLNDVAKINWSTGKISAGYRANSWFDNTSFEGNIDGNGCVVYGLYFETDNKNLTWGYWGAGFIPRVNVGKSVSVTSLGIENAYIYGVNGASAFVGFAGNESYTEDTSLKATVTLQNCFVGENVFVQGNDTGAFRGGTYNSVTTIKNSYSKATLRGASTKGLIGNSWEAPVYIENCFNTKCGVTTEVYNSEYVGKNLDNVYVAEYTEGEYGDVVTVLTLEKMQGIDAVNTMSLPNDFVAVQDTAPVLKAFCKYSANINGKKYIGFKNSQYSKLFTSGEDKFLRYDSIDVTGDNEMNICDLVYATKKYNNGKTTFDIDNDKETTEADVTVLRKALIGNTDYNDKPKKYTPYNTNLSDKYEYVWGDEFGEDYLNGNKWAISAKMGDNPSKGFYNNKDEKVIAVEDGNLRLTAYKDDEGNYHVPTSVITRNSMNFKYGYVEIRAKLPLQTGVWSSFWALSVQASANVSSLATAEGAHIAEIDMFEVYDTNQVSGGIIKWASPGWYPTGMNKAQSVRVPSANEYHIYGYEWTPTEINYYYDGVLYARFDITESWTNPGEYGKGIDGWTYLNADKTETNMDCFREPQYLVFNNHLFYEGVSNASTSIAISNPDFKRADYLIDYCRVYQLPEGSEIYTK